MDVTPATGFGALTDMTGAQPSQRRSWREILRGGFGRGALVALVFVLGLVQGSRAALGDMPLGELPPVESAPPASVTEADALRGSFFRPAGSSAVRPTPSLHQSRWKPAEARRLALD